MPKALDEWAPAGQRSAPQPGQDSMKIILLHAPEAAQWWRQHAPRAVAPGELFIFAAEACQEVA